MSPKKKKKCFVFAGETEHEDESANDLVNQPGPSSRPDEDVRVPGEAVLGITEKNK